MTAVMRSVPIRYWLALACMLGLAGWLSYWSSVSVAIKLDLPVYPWIDMDTRDWIRTIPGWQDMIYHTATLSFLLSVFLMLRRSWLTVFAFSIGILMERIDWIFLSTNPTSLPSILTMLGEAGGLVLLFMLIREDYLN